MIKRLLFKLKQFYLLYISKNIEKYNALLCKYFGIKIGKRCRIYSTRFGSEPFLIEIGEHCTITNGVSFITHDGGLSLFRDEIPYFQRFAPIKIEENCFIGVNSIIMPGVKIGKNSVVGAGSVVTKSIPEGSVFAGIPAKFICTTEAYFEKNKIEYQKLLDMGINLKTKENLSELLEKYEWE